ncbi:multidrug transporter AcrB, partial [Modestobacter versicolor]
VMFLAGQTGLLFRELAIAMIAAIAFSGFISLSLAPMLCSKLLRHSERSRLSRWVDDRFQRLEAGYARLLDRVLKRPVLALVPVLLFLAGAGVLFTTLPTELAPAEDTGVVDGQVTAPEGTGFDRMNAYMHRIETDLQPLRDEGTLQVL